MYRKKTTKRPKRTPNKKDQFRKSKEWKDFRQHMSKVFENTDYVTGKKLTKKFNLHHLKTNLTEDAYCDISNENDFIPLNPYTHKFLHYVFPTYKKDPKIIDRFVELLNKMVKFEA